MEEEKVKILIIEDEKPMARALELKLNHSGFEAESVFDGNDALAILNKKKYDLILLDLMMKGADGFTVLTEIKAKEIETPVIVLSNLGQKEDIERARKLGAMEYFVKSNISIMETIKQIKKILNV